MLEKLHPILLASIQTNHCLDEALAFLLFTLYRIHTSSGTRESPSIPLSALLPVLAASHPDPTIRHITFRILSLLLSLTPSVTRLEILKGLVEGDPDDREATGAMTVAAVGLVREAIVDAFSPSPSSATLQNIFKTPHLLQTLGPILLRPSPPDLFSTPSGLKILQDPDSVEPARLTECLGFYYTLLIRDVGNSVRTIPREA